MSSARELLILALGGVPAEEHRDAVAWRDDRVREARDDADAWREETNAAIRLNEEVRAAAQALVDALPTCKVCRRPATRFCRGQRQATWCDEHFECGCGGPFEKSISAPLRALVVVLESYQASPGALEVRAILSARPDESAAEAARRVVASLALSREHFERANEANDEARDELHAAMAQVSTLAADLEQARDELGMACSEIEVRGADIEQLRSKLACSEENLAGACADVKRLIGDLATRTAERDAAYDAAHDANAPDCDDMPDAIARLDEELCDLTVLLSKAEAEAARYRSALEEAERRLTRAHAYRPEIILTDRTGYRESDVAVAEAMNILHAALTSTDPADPSAVARAWAERSKGGV